MSLPQLKNDILLRSFLREPVPYTPVWLMRQAGRYLPEYRATRAEAGSFMDLAQNKEYACEVTLQPLRRFDLDASILFSDILTIPHAMGLGLDFVQGEGPQFAHPIRNEDDVKRLAIPDMSKLQYVFDAVHLIRKELDGKVPLIGFAGSPWTIACYMVEGQGSKDYRLIKGMMYGRPDLVHQMLEINAQTTIQYLNEQIKAGAQAAMIFDSWGGVMADTLFQEFSLQYTKKVVDGLIRNNDGRRVPVVVFTKGGGQWLEDIIHCGADALGVDWTVNMSKARQRLQDKVALQGNMDPMVMFGGEEAVRREVRRVIDDFGPVTNGSGHVFNFGHGISQFTPPEMVKVLVDEVHSYSAQMHQN